MSSSTEATLEAPTLSMRLDGVKGLRFDWQAPVGVERQTLWVDPDGEAGPLAPVELGPLTAEARTHWLEVFLPSALGARYRLRACDASDCADSTWVGVDDLNQAIGYLKASNPGAADRFAYALALSSDGTRLAVAARDEDGQSGGVNPAEDRGPSNWDTGAVYVFGRAASGWRQEARLKASHPDWGDSFGMDIDLSEDGRVLLVGAPNDDSPGQDPTVNGQPETGAAFVFERDEAGRWLQSAYLKSPASLAGSQFGLHVALSGDGQWAAVNARNLASMYATVFQRRSSGWAWVAQLPAGNNPSDQYAGRRLSMDREGRTLALGVATDTRPGQEIDPALPPSPVQSGAVYLFERDAQDQWGPALRLLPQVAAPRMQFGWATALSADGRRLVVGAAPREAAVAFRGGAYVFDRTASGWAQSAALLPDQTQPLTRAGYAVDISADGRGLVISDIGDGGAGLGLNPDGLAIGEAGAVSWYQQREDGGWQARRLKAPNNQARMRFGFSLALSADGSTLAVGADGEAAGVDGGPDDRSAPGAGAVYLY